MSWAKEIDRAIKEIGICIKEIGIAVKEIGIRLKEIVLFKKIQNIKCWDTYIS